MEVLDKLDSILLKSGFSKKYIEYLDSQIKYSEYRKENCIVTFNVKIYYYIMIFIDQICISEYKNISTLNDRELSKYIRKSKLESLIVNL